MGCPKRRVVFQTLLIASMIGRSFNWETLGGPLGVGCSVETHTQMQGTLTYHCESSSVKTKDGF